MAKVAVQSEELHTQSAAVKSGAADVSEILGRLTSQITNLAGQWEGSASQAFQARWQEWQSGAQNVQQAMEHMGLFLDQAGDAYEQNEEALRRGSGGA
jgi:WXG100 family type VII secretion target